MTLSAQLVQHAHAALDRSRLADARVFAGVLLLLVAAAVVALSAARARETFDAILAQLPDGSPAGDA